MKVLFVNDSATGRAGTGGVEIHIPQVRRELAKRGVQTALLAQQPRGYPEVQTADEFFISYFNAPPLRKHPVRNHRQHQAALERAAECVRAFRPDVIHVHNLMNPGALRMLRQYGPVVKSTHDCRPFCVKPQPVVASRLVGDSEEFCDICFGKSCWKRCYAHSGKTPIQRLEAWSYFRPNLKALHEITQADELIVYSWYLETLAMRTMPDPQRIHIINLFTDAEFASAGPSSVPEGKPVFLFAGRLSPEKGILKVFDALDRIPHVACKLVVAGDGPIRDEVNRRIQTSHPAHEIEMKGFLDQSQLYEQYRSASVLLFPSIGSEGLGLSGIEAMYFGTPAIGFDVGGIGEWLIDGETGVLLPRGDIVGLAQAMEDLASSPEKIKMLGYQARAFSRKKFTREAHISQLITIYQKAIQTAPS